MIRCFLRLNLSTACGSPQTAGAGFMLVRSFNVRCDGHFCRLQTAQCYANMVTRHHPALSLVAAKRHVATTAGYAQAPPLASGGGAGDATSPSSSAAADDMTEERLTAHRARYQQIPSGPKSAVQPRPSLAPLDFRRGKFEYFNNYGWRTSWQVGSLANWCLYVIGGFLAMTIYLEILMHPLEDTTSVKVPEMPMTDYEREQLQRQEDPNRVPWPLVHLHMTEIREGKRPHDELPRLWEQTKFFYPGDWLVPVEMVQILKYTTPKFLSQYVADPEALRKEVLFQLLSIKYDKVRTIDRSTRETKEIINIAIEELRNMSFLNPDEIPLVPTHSK